MVHPDTGQLAQIVALINAGDIKPAVTKFLPLTDAARAHELSQAGHVRERTPLLSNNCGPPGSILPFSSPTAASYSSRHTDRWPVPMKTRG